MVNSDNPKADAPSKKSTLSDEGNTSNESNSDCKRIKSKHVLQYKPDSPYGIIKSVGISHAKSTIPDDPKIIWTNAKRKSLGQSSSASDIGVRGVTRMRSFFDVTGTSTCASGFNDGSSISGESGAVALQIPSSSIPIPLSNSAMAVSVHSNSSTTFFQTLSPRVSGLGSTLPQGSGCGPCIFSNHSSSLDLSSDTEDTDMEAVTTIIHSTAVEEAALGRPAGVFGCSTTLEMLFFGAEEENGMMKWLEALEFQAVGACRADERLRPLLRWNVSCFGANGRLLAHLGLHFKAKELSLLARCLCTPLVSLRVGKISRRGLILQPTSIRGFLRLSMLPCSELQLSFKGDNGSVEILATISRGNEASPLLLEEIGADPSGRSFVLKSHRELAYFWHSEKSKVAGDELVSKMKNLLACRPTLAQLTGIKESRLDSFASYIPSISQTSCLTSMEVSQASTIVNPPTRTSASAVIPHTSYAGQSFFPLQDLQEDSLFRSLPVSITLQPSHERSNAFGEGSDFCAGGLLNPFNVSGDPRIKNRECGDLVGSLLSSVSARSSTQHTSRTFVNNASWSTRTSICFGSNGNSESSSYGASNCTSSYSPSLGAVQNSKSWIPFEPAMDQSCLPVISSPQTLLPFPSFISEASPNGCTFLPPLSTRLPISASSLFVPYYCPCPLGSVSALQSLHCTFSPSLLPTDCSEGELRHTSPFFSDGTPSPAFLPASLELHQLQYSFPFPVLPSETAGLNAQTSGVSSFFSGPITHLPVVSLHVPAQEFIVQALPVVSRLGNSPVVPDFFQDIFSCRSDLQAEGHDRSFSNPVGGRLWGIPAIVEGHVTEADSFLLSNAIRKFPPLPEARVTAMGVKIKEGINFNKFDTLKLSCDPGMSNVDHELQQGALENMLKFNLPSLQGPILEMVPRVLSSSSLSRIISLRSSGNPTETNWLPHSLGLHNCSCEIETRPVIFSPGNLTADSLSCLVQTNECLPQRSCQDHLSLNLRSLAKGKAADDEMNEDFEKGQK